MPRPRLTPRLWPEAATEAADFDALVKPIVSLIKQGYRVVRRPSRKLRYRGLQLGRRELVVCSPLEQTLAPSTLSYHKRNGRSLLTMAVTIAVQLGIEQGRRLAAEEFRVDLILANAYRKTVEETAKK